MIETNFANNFFLAVFLSSLFLIVMYFHFMKK